MKPIQRFYLALLLTLTFLWLLADTLAPTPFTYFSFRTVFMQYSGVIAISVMSIAMLLALRPRMVEPALDGLDKMYRLHKWLGITALVVAILHWWWGQGTKWMVSWGWLIRPARGRRPTDAELGMLEAWLRSQRGLAETVGEWAFYAAVVLLVLALVKWFPYRLFKKTHNWLAALYLAFVYHAVVLLKFAYWTQPIGWFVAALLAGGSVAAIMVLSGRIGAGRKVRGTIESLRYYPELRVLETGIALEAGWPGHVAGQFAFATSDSKEGAHPYTIASAWNPEDRRITFITKALGDHTRRLHDRLKVGMPITVEGPYGCFDFQDKQPRQIWIGAGIGITPFIARMKHLAAAPDHLPVDLFHSTSAIDEDAFGKLTADAKAAGIRLHIVISSKEGRLDGARIRAVVPDWKNASIWFCGPAGFAQALRADFQHHGLAPQHFHQELFEMR
ncbi:putative ferric reductase [Paucimonas lemoignei]|uniref:Putative ferric reductase n=1 Tax=Paucimonas lemoignei TaxID=29443 RepID=A0A4R3HUB8_PAULE|nr:ferric reductase-like transmembrane domain-containing protein [Paucimonas lemoignei]TCS36294.1 putative ferric reductase [Paucimonas lemoignei]